MDLPRRTATWYCAREGETLSYMARRTSPKPSDERGIGSADPAAQSLDLQVYSDRLLAAASDDARLERAYADYIQAALDAPLWSAECPDGVRIPWRLAKQATAHPSLHHALGSPGIYLFGDEEGVILYLGMATTTLWKRLRGRYVAGPRAQCQLAADYASDLLAAGNITGFPEQIRAWYRRAYKGSTVRLEGALSFAQHGVEGIWVTVLPIADTASIHPLERALIHAANAWNHHKGYQPQLNKQHVRKDPESKRIVKVDGPVPPV